MRSIGINLELIRIDLELIGIDLESIGIDLELIRIDLELIGIDLELIGIDLELIGIDLELIGIDLELIGIDLELIGIDSRSIPINRQSITCGGATISPHMKWWVTAALTALIYTAVTYALIETRGGDVSRFVVAGGPGVDPRAVPRGLTVTPETGYDGVAFYRLALDPFTSKKTDFGIGLDNPPYRQQRIGYPLIVWMLSGGGAPQRVPLLLLAVNFAGLIAIGAAGGALAKSFGRSALWGLLFPLYPGFLMTLSRDTSEIVAWAFGLGAILAMTRDRNVAAAVLLTCAVLTRETTLTIVAGVALVECGRLVRTRGRDVRSPLVFVAPLAVFLAWQLFLAHRWGTMPLIAGTPPLTFPFAEYVAIVKANARRHLQLQRIYFAECAYLAVIVLTALATLRRSTSPLAIKVAWAADVVIAAMLPHDFWAEHFAYMRILANASTLSAVLLVGSNAAARWIAVIATVGMWYYLALHVVALR